MKFGFKDKNQVRTLFASLYIIIRTFFLISIVLKSRLYMDGLRLTHPWVYGWRGYLNMQNLGVFADGANHRDHDQRLGFSPCLIKLHNCFVAVGAFFPDFPDFHRLFLSTCLWTVYGLRGSQRLRFKNPLASQAANIVGLEIVKFPLPALVFTQAHTAKGSVCAFF
jgi:hypothetical protein